MNTFDFNNAFSTELSLKDAMITTAAEERKAIAATSIELAAVKKIVAEQAAFKAEALEFAKTQKWDVERVLASPICAKQVEFLQNEFDAANAGYIAAKEAEDKATQASNDAFTAYSQSVKDLLYVPAKPGALVRVAK